MKKNKIDKITFLLIIATLVRIYLSVKIPLYLQAGAVYDDNLFIAYSNNLLSLKWLGEFGYLTLSKSISFSIFIVILHIFEIPYSLGLVLCYIFSLHFLIKALKPLIKNKWFSSIVYILMLYSPIMFHIENTQKVYRGGLIIIGTVLVVASIIGIFTRRNGKTLYKWIILSSLAVPFFYYIKEDSIWLLPFIIGGLTITIIYYCIENKKSLHIKNIFAFIIPLISLLICSLGYKTMNYFQYGEFAITDRNDTYYSLLLSELYKMNINDDNPRNVWISRKTINEAIKYSPTMKEYEYIIDDMYNTSWALVNGEFESDFLYWALKEQFAKEGFYVKNGKKINNIYKKMYKELHEAYSRGDLKYSKKIYISKSSCGYSIDEINKVLVPLYVDSIKMISSYSENETSLHYAYGNNDELAIMSRLTNSQSSYSVIDGNIYNEQKVFIKIANVITKIYQNLGIPISILAGISLIIFVVNNIINLLKKQYNTLPLFLIILGLIISANIIIIGSIWFSSSFGDSIGRHVYNYSCGGIILYELVKYYLVYYLIIWILNLKKFMLNKRSKDEKRK